MKTKRVQKRLENGIKKEVQKVTSIDMRLLFFDQVILAGFFFPGK